MSRLVFVLIALFLVASVPLYIGGCPSDNGGTDQVDPNDSDPNDTTGDDPNDTDPNDTTGDDVQCGTRSVTTAMSAGYYRFVTAAVLDATPDDSGLAKVVFQAALCPEDHGTSTYPLYEVDASGNVVAMISLFESGTQKVYYRTAVTNLQLELDGGCIRSSSTSSGSDNSDLVDPNDITDNPCGLGSFPISRDGLESGTPDGAYICVEMHTVSACQDCWYASGLWTSEITTTGYYVALGSLTGVSVEDWAAVCDPEHQDATVNITLGDRVDFTWTITTTYEASDSPEEMGYQQVSFAP